MRLTLFRETPSTLIIMTNTKKELIIRSIDFWAYFKDFESKETVYQKRDFRIIRVAGDSITILLKDGSERTITYTDFVPIWNKYVEIKSEKIGDYNETSKNAAYIVPAIILFLESKGVARSRDVSDKSSKSSIKDEKQLVYQKIVNKLIKQSETYLSQNKKFETLANNMEANSLLNDIDKYPHVFALACIIGSPIATQNTWDIPYLFMKRLGSFKFEDIKKLSLEEITKKFSEPTPLDAYPDMMAKIFYRAVQDIENIYSGDASKIWNDNPSSETLVNRFNDFYSVGDKNANMAANILIRLFKIPLKDNIAINISTDINSKRVFQRLGIISENMSNEDMMKKAKELNPSYPALFDYSILEIGEKWCHPINPDCKSCYMSDYCPSKH